MIKYIVYFIDPLKTKKPLVPERSTELTAKSCRRERLLYLLFLSQRWQAITPHLCMEGHS